MPAERGCGWRDGAGSGAGREGGMLGSGAGQGETLPGNGLGGTGAVWEESWYVGVLACEDAGLGSVWKQKGLIFFF